MKSIPLFVIFLLLVACSNLKNKTPRQEESLYESRKKLSPKERDSIEELQISYAFDRGLQLAMKEETYFETSDSVEIHVFNANEKYAFIRFQAYSFNTKIGLYRINDSKIDTLFEENWGIGYSQDSIRDVNDDGYLDVLTSYNAPSGCCARNLVSIRLYNPDLSKFEEKKKFMNPTFFPEEKLILGVKYGHPGEVPLYQYKWNGYNIDTIEYVYPVKELKNRFVVEPSLLNTDEINDLMNHENIVKGLPDVYKRVGDIDLAWFLNYQNK